ARGGPAGVSSRTPEGVADRAGGAGGQRRGGDERRDRLCRPGGATPAAHGPGPRPPSAVAGLFPRWRPAAAGGRHPGTHRGGAGGAADRGADGAGGRAVLSVVAAAHTHAGRAVVTAAGTPVPPASVLEARGVSLW